MQLGCTLSPWKELLKLTPGLTHDNCSDAWLDGEKTAIKDILGTITVFTYIWQWHFFFLWKCICDLDLFEYHLKTIFLFKKETFI